MPYSPVSFLIQKFHRWSSAGVSPPTHHHPPHMVIYVSSVFLCVLFSIWSLLSLPRLLFLFPIRFVEACLYLIRPLIYSFLCFLCLVPFCAYASILSLPEASILIEQLVRPLLHFSRRFVDCNSPPFPLSSLCLIAFPLSFIAPFSLPILFFQYPFSVLIYFACKFLLLPSSVLDASLDDRFLPLPSISLFVIGSAVDPMSLLLLCVLLVV